MNGIHASTPCDPPGDKRGPPRGARGQDTVVENQVDLRPRRQHGQPLQQLQRIEAQVRRPVRPAVPQREPDRPLGTDVQPVLGERRTQRVSADPLRRIALFRPRHQPRVEIKPPTCA